MEKFEYCAPCLFGVEGILGDELRRMGAENVRPENGRVLFCGGLDILARANITSRYAERIQIVMGRFKALSFEELFQGVRALPWERFIGKLDAFPVKGWSLNSQLHSVPDCQAVVKKAVVERLGRVYGIQWFDECDGKCQIQFTILKDEVTLLLDTSGVGLHKRGYRAISGGAPIKETLAAAIVDVTRARRAKLVCDPCCGSGTLLIGTAFRPIYGKRSVSWPANVKETWSFSPAVVTSTPRCCRWYPIMRLRQASAISSPPPRRTFAIFARTATAERYCAIRPMVSACWISRRRKTSTARWGRCLFPKRGGAMLSSVLTSNLRSCSADRPTSAASSTTVC